MAILDAGENLARAQVDPGEQAQRAMALIFMVTRPACMKPRLRDRSGAVLLIAWMPGFFLVGDDRDVRLDSFALTQDRDLAIDPQHFRHLPLEGLVAALEVVADLVRLHVVSVEDLADRGLRQAHQAGMPCCPGRLLDVSRQQPRGPKLVRISQLLGLLAGQGHHPCAGDVRAASRPLAA
jgi:hypothetical protein